MPGPPGTLAGSQILDQPPPSPAVDQSMAPGFPSVGAMVPLQSERMPQDVLTGVAKAGMKMAEDLDSFAQMMPDLAPDWAAVRSALASAMSKVLMAGAGPSSPTAVGPGFPGGGFDKGGMALASGGTAP